MSRDSSDPPDVDRKEPTPVEEPVTARKGWFLPMLGHGSWLVVSFVSASLIVYLLSLLIERTVGSLDKLVSYNLYLVIVSVVAYGLMLSIQVLGSRYIFHQPVSRQIFGITKGGSRWKDIATALVGFVIYMVGAAALLLLASRLFPNFNVDQAQNLGFDKLLPGLEIALVFVLFVIIDPIFEESIFRGFLYGQLKRIHVPTWLNVVFTSALFGAAHMQWNVGLNVFVLSVVMCLMREYTGSIYAGMILHGLKNALAFYLVFYGFPA